jgi:hypothetical protein
MADVYELAIGKPAEGGFEGIQVMTKIELIDAVGDKDEWHTDNDATGSGVIGEGGGDWIRRGSLNQIVLMNQDATAVEAVLTYPNWPLKTGDMGKVKLTKALRGNPSAGTQLEWSYMVMEVK